MSTFILFNPPTNGPFRFQPELDGQTYICTITWSLFGQRWYMNLNTTDGTLILSRALIGSIDGHDIQSMSWDHGRVHVTTLLPHNHLVLSTVDLVITNCAPDILNGNQRCFIDGPSSLTYELPTAPGNITKLGQVNMDINLVENYFATSSLVFRESSQQFIVSP